MGLFDISYMKKNVLLISGTCAAGKTTIGTLLSEKYGYHHIEGDEVKKHAQQRDVTKKINWNEMHSEILQKSLQSEYEKIVISYVILPDKLSLYKDFYEKHDISFSIVILMPSLANVYERNNTRTCWNRPTPKKFIDEFYNAFLANKDKYGKYFLNNTSLDIEETAEKIVATKYS